MILNFFFFFHQEPCDPNQLFIKYTKLDWIIQNVICILMWFNKDAGSLDKNM